MQLLRVVDLSVYFLAGVFLYLFIDGWKHAKSTEPRSAGQQCKRWALAILVGLVLAGARFLVTYMGKLKTLRQLPVNVASDPLLPPPLDSVVPVDLGLVTPAPSIPVLETK